MIVDGMQGGSGERFEWDSLEVPVQEAHAGWLLAGGLDSGVVAAAIGIAAPTGVDVSSGVCGPDGALSCEAVTWGIVWHSVVGMQGGLVTLLLFDSSFVGRRIAQGSSIRGGIHPKRQRFHCRVTS